MILRCFFGTGLKVKTIELALIEGSKNDLDKQRALISALKLRRAAE
jgi:hypothetical protein